jgi:hypothetical protein
MDALSIHSRRMFLSGFAPYLTLGIYRDKRHAPPAG